MDDLGLGCVECGKPALLVGYEVAIWCPYCGALQFWGEIEAEPVLKGYGLEATWLREERETRERVEAQHRHAVAAHELERTMSSTSTEEEGTFSSALASCAEAEYERAMRKRNGLCPTCGEEPGRASPGKTSELLDVLEKLVPLCGRGESLEVRDAIFLLRENGRSP
jgi:uncharacterized Zn finger protein (UPF0148 family)